MFVCISCNVMMFTLCSIMSCSKHCIMVAMSSSLCTYKYLTHAVQGVPDFHDDLF